jgi:epoxide hydrolase 4
VKLLCTLALFVAMLFAYPIRAADADPAIAYANAHRSGDFSYTEGWFGKGDTRLHYVEAGEGPLVILYHGFPSFWFSWFDQMEALKGSYRVVALDGLGAGLSAKPERLGPYRIDRLAKQLDALARHLNGGKRFILVGHDWGAALAFSYAQAYPKRLNAVAGLSAPPYNLFLDTVASDKEQQARSQYMQRFRALKLKDIKAGNMSEQIARSAYAGLVESGDLYAEEAALFQAAVGDPYAINAGMNWYRANIGDFAAISEKDRWPRHDRPITVPALLLWGDADRTFVAGVPDRMRAIATNLEVITLPGVGHWAPIEKPQLANDALIAFLKAHAAKAK